MGSVCDLRRQTIDAHPTDVKCHTGGHGDVTIGADSIRREEVDRSRTVLDRSRANDRDNLIGQSIPETVSDPKQAFMEE